MNKSACTSTDNHTNTIHTVHKAYVTVRCDSLLLTLIHVDIENIDGKLAADLARDERIINLIGNRRMPLLKSELTTSS